MKRRRPKMKTLLLPSAALFLVAACAPAGRSQSNPLGSSTDALRSIDSVAIAPTGMPLGISSLKITEADSHGLSRIRFSAVNQGADRIDEFRFVVAILDSGGRTRSVEGWTEEVRVPPSRLGFTVTYLLSNVAEPGNRGIFVLRSVTTTEGVWYVDQAALPEIVKSGGESASGRPSAKFEKGAPASLGAVSDPSFSSAIHEQAAGDCADGIASFVCDALKQTYSYSCK
jgi:hypothetical protein